MDKKMIGSMVSYERNKKKIGYQQLAHGLCSPAAIQRLENGERVPNYFILERIIERLGKSLSKMEFLYDEDVYDIYYLRGLIEQYFEEEDYQNVEEALEYYETLSQAKEPLHRQYIYKIKGIVLSEAKQCHAEAANLFEKALLESVKGFDIDRIDDYLLGEEELILIMLWVKEVWLSNEHISKAKAEKLFSYIERHCEDEEVRINIYTKAAWLIGSLFIREGDMQEALRYTLKGEEVLADNAVLLHMPEFLERILYLTSRCKEETHEEWKRQRDALKELYDEYEEEWAEGWITLWKKYRQQEVYLFSEVFGQERKRRNMSQEKLADALEMDQKTISRIESGKFKPKIGTFQKLKDYLQVERDICTTRIVVDDFHLLEMERNIAKLNSDGGEQESEKLYLELKQKLSLKWKENQQYVKFTDAFYDNRLRNVTYEETLQTCLEAFHITREGIDIAEAEYLILSGIEVVVLNYIAICFGRLNQKEISIEILENITLLVVLIK